MEVYCSLLATFEGRLGKGVTMGDDLDREGRKAFGGHEWQGVYAYDGPWRERIGKGGYMIVNLDSKGQKGSHWVAIAGRMLYDSFGRKSILGVGSGLQDAERDAEQKKSEDNCGQRCLAWLGVYRLLGPDIAYTI